MSLEAGAYLGMDPMSLGSELDERTATFRSMEFPQ